MVEVFVFMFIYFFSLLVSYFFILNFVINCIAYIKCQQVEKLYKWTCSMSSGKVAKGRSDAR